MISAAEVLSLLLLTRLIPGGRAGAQPVAALLHRSVEFYYPDLSLPVLDVIWQFLTQNKTTKVGMYHNNKFTYYDPQFTDRLEISDKGVKLRIKDLRMEDTGVYTAVMTFTDNEIRHVSYALTVYEPIPSLNVDEKKEKTPDGCNVTLHCSVPSNTSDFSYTWKYRHQDSAEYQSIDNAGRNIQISLPPDHQDTEYLCIVQNPADQKNFSVSVKSCFGTDRSRHYHWYILSIILFIILTAGAIMWKRRRKQTKKEEELEYYMPESHSTEPSSSISLGGQQCGIALSPEPSAAMPGSGEEPDLLKRSWKQEGTLHYGEVAHRSNPPTQEFKTLYTCLELKT